MKVSHPDSQSLIKNQSGSAKLKAVIYSPDPPFFACPYIRLWSPLSVAGPIKAVAGCVYYITGYHSNLHLAEQADVIIIQRNFVRNYETTDQLLKITSRRGIPAIFEIDDDLMNLPPKHPNYRDMLGFRTDVERVAPRFDAIIVSTEYLEKSLSDFGPPVYVVPNLVDGRLWSPSLRAKAEGKVVIGYMGTPTHREDLACVVPALKRVLDKYPKTVEIHFWGGIHPDLLGKNVVKFISPLNVNYPEFAAQFAGRRPDIAIAPLKDIPFNWAKSSIKYLEYASLRIPGVYSNVGPYRAAVADGETGLVVNNVESEWIDALSRLIADDALREQIGAAARLDVMRHHSLARQGGGLSELLVNLAAAKRDLKDAVPATGDFTTRVGEPLVIS